VSRAIHEISLFSATFLCGRSAWNKAGLEDTMKKFVLNVKKFLKSEDGPTAVEYAVMLALIVIVCLTAISSIGTNANTQFQRVAQSIGGGS
jgi:pilus assembly protein Flp/PilA